MTCEKKMNKLIKHVLGDKYSVTVCSDNKYYILYNGIQDTGVECAKSISSHWKELITSAIIGIIKHKIQNFKI